MLQATVMQAHAALYSRDSFTRQSSEAPVTQGGVAFLFVDVFEVVAELIERLGKVAFDAEVADGVAEEAPYEKFQREIIHVQNV